MQREFERIKERCAPDHAVCGCRSHQKSVTACMPCLQKTTAMTKCSFVSDQAPPSCTDHGNGREEETLASMIMLAAACRSYRKNVIAGMLGLHHLDDMPVTPKERRLAIAFLQGGLEVNHHLISAAIACHIKAGMMSGSQPAHKYALCLTASVTASEVVVSNV